MDVENTNGLGSVRLFGRRFETVINTAVGSRSVTSQAWTGYVAIANFISVSFFS